jgi:hypothetical protein
MYENFLTLFSKKKEIFEDWGGGLHPDNSPVEPALLLFKQII